MRPLLPTGHHYIDTQLQRYSNIVQGIYHEAAVAGVDRPRTAEEWMTWFHSKIGGEERADLGLISLYTTMSDIGIRSHFYDPLNPFHNGVRLASSLHQVVYKGMPFTDVCRSLGIADRDMWMQILPHQVVQVYNKDWTLGARLDATSAAGFQFDDVTRLFWTHIDLTPLNQVVADLDHLYRHPNGKEDILAVEILVDAVTRMDLRPLIMWSSNRPWAFIVARFMAQ